MKEFMSLVLYGCCLLNNQNIEDGVSLLHLYSFVKQRFATLATKFCHISLKLSFP